MDAFPSGGSGGFEDDMIGILGLGSRSDGDIHHRSPDDVLSVLDEENRLTVRKIHVVCNVMPGTTLANQGISKIVPLEKYDAVLTGETRSTQGAGFLSEVTYEIAPASTPSFQPEELFRMLDAVMTILEDYAPRVEI